MPESQRDRWDNPIDVLTEDGDRTSGADAQAMNIEAGTAIAEAIRTTLGPNGMDKMLVSDDGDVVITNDGATILEEMDIDHPTGRILTEIVDSQRQAVGDGTTTTAILAGELLTEAEGLLEDGIHPTTIVQGYAIGWEVAIEAIESRRSDEPTDEQLRQVATAAMAGKGISRTVADVLAASIVDAVRTVRTDGSVATGAIDIIARPGQGATATELLDGIVAETEPIDDSAPTDIEDATVAVFSSSLTTTESRARFQSHDVEYAIDDAEGLDGALDAEREQLDEVAAAIIDAGVDVVVVTETEEIDDRIVDQLSRAGILAFEDVKYEVADSIRNVTGTSNIHQLEELEAAALGRADSVRTVTFGDDTELIVEKADNDSHRTLLVRGSTDHVLAELERAVRDAHDATVAALDGGVVAGAGATELALAGVVRDHAAGLDGREQLVVSAFGDALESIPRTLANNAGLDPIDTLVALRSKGTEGVPAGVVGIGRDAAVTDAIEAGVLDPAAVKQGAIRTAAEAAVMIVRIDDVISAE